MKITRSTFPRIESLKFPGMGTDFGVLIVVKNEEEAKRAQADLSAAKEEYARLEKYSAALIRRAN